MKVLNIDDQTHKRLTSLMNDLMQEKKLNLSVDDVINELIDVYHDSLAFSGENSGG